jgi:hypothetical protein
MAESREFPGVGGLLQTQALGPQDAHLYQIADDTPHCNPFTAPRRLHPSRGAIEVKEQAFSPFRFDAINRVEIQRAGDLLGDIVLEITLPDLSALGGTSNDRWLKNIGYILIKHIRLSLNDTELNSSERLYYDLYEQLYESAGTRQAIQQMIGSTPLPVTLEHVIHVPLKLFTSKRRGERQTFMPLISTPASSLYLEIETESFQNCVTSFSGRVEPTTVDCRLLTEYVFLDTAEKERIINEPQLLLIETVRDAEGYSFREVSSSDGLNQIVPTDTVVVSLKEMNFPVKAIIFAAYRTTSLQSGEYFTYTDVIESASIRFDGNDRTEGLEPVDYYRLVVPYMHAPRCVNDNVFFYSFALQPNLLQPTGTFTYSNIREGDIYVKLKAPARDVVVKAFVIGYSWVEFKNGYASTLFS